MGHRISAGHPRGGPPLALGGGLPVATIALLSGAVLLQCSQQLLRCSHELLRCSQQLLWCSHKLLRCSQRLLRCPQWMLWCSHKLLQCSEYRPHQIGCPGLPVELGGGGGATMVAARAQRATSSNASVITTSTPCASCICLYGKTTLCYWPAISVFFLLNVSENYVVYSKDYILSLVLV